MQIFDIIIIAVASLFVGIGVRRGFIEEIFHLAAMLGGFIGAYLCYPFIYTRIGFLKTAAPTKTIIAFILAYICIAFSLIVIGWILKKIIHMTILGWIDRLLGGLIGLCKAAIMIWIFILSVSLLPNSKVKSAFSSSAIYSFLTKLPVKLSVPGTKELRKSYEILKKADPVKKLKETKEKIEKFTDKIDTFRTFIDST